MRHLTAIRAPTALRLLTLLVTLPACTTAAKTDSVAAQNRVTTFYVVRHAEKVDSSDDSLLTDQGKARAKDLATVLADFPIEAIYSTRFQRTAQTVWPVAIKKGLKVVTKTPNARLLLQRHPGKHVLIAGHSNTVPELIRQLGVVEPVLLEHDDYGDLFVVSVTGTAATLSRERFGDGATP